MAWRTLLAAAAASLLALAARAQPIELVDDGGHRVKLPRAPQRIVTLGAHLAEQLYAIGAGDRIVGVSRFTDFPAEVRAKPVVGDAVAIHHEAIAQLKPDLVLVWRSGFPERARAPLKALGVPVYESEIRSVPELAASLRTLGRLVGLPEAGQAQAAAVEQQWAALQAEYASRAPVRVFYQIWHQPLMTVNHDHLIHQALSACGGRNLFAELPALTPTVSWEAAVQRNPQVIALARGAGTPPEFGRWPEFPQVDAVRHQRYALVEGDWISRMGPRFLQGVRQLCEGIDKAR
jgi:iron complex transport system substrate-binding protein